MVNYGAESDSPRVEEGKGQDNWKIMGSSHQKDLRFRLVQYHDELLIKRSYFRFDFYNRTYKGKYYPSIGFNIPG